MTSAPIRPFRLGWATVFSFFAVVGWWTWVLVSPALTGRRLSLATPYLSAPLFLVVGVLAGWLVARHWRTWLAMPLAVGGLLVLSLPLYANAQGAVGVQLVALAGLTVLPGTRDLNGRRATNAFPASVGLLVVGVLLAARSDASATLAVPLAILVALTLAHRVAPALRVIVAVGAVVLVAAAAAVISLGSLDDWPERLNQGTSLSKARHTLWSDALSLWAQNPLTGGGVGSFTEHSSLASANASLATVHSSVLQVGSELGLVGVLLFAGLIAAGIAIACGGARQAALVGVAAWTCLGVHSMIDHLYEFPIVTVSAGLVLGWAASTTGDQERVRPL